MTAKSTPRNATGKPFTKGNGGRPKGIPNKSTRQLKEMILKALDEVGGIEYLVERATDPKTSAAFMTLLGKVLPMTLAGDPDAPIAIQVIQRRIIDPKNGGA